MYYPYRSSMMRFTRCAVCTCCVCFPENMMMKCQYSIDTRRVLSAYRAMECCSTCAFPKLNKIQWCTEHIEFPAKLLDYFLRSNKSNINQSALKVSPGAAPFTISCHVSCLSILFCFFFCTWSTCVVQVFVLVVGWSVLCYYSGWEDIYPKAHCQEGPVSRVTIWTGHAWSTLVQWRLTYHSGGHDCNGLYIPE